MSLLGSVTKEIWANYSLPKALKSCPKSNKLPNLGTLLLGHKIMLILASLWDFASKILIRLPNNLNGNLFQRVWGIEIVVYNLYGLGLHTSQLGVFKDTSSSVTRC